MAKANRKRANKNIENKEIKPIGVEKEHTIYDDFSARTLSQTDADRMKEIFTLSNNVAALIRDYAEKEIAVKHMRHMAKQILTERQPLMVQVAKNMYKTEKNFETVSKDILKQADEIEKSLVLIHGQIEHRYEDYISTLIRHERFIDSIVKSVENKKITGHRSDAITKAEEEKIFEKEFDEQLKQEQEKTNIKKE